MAGDGWGTPGGLDTTVDTGAGFVVKVSTTDYVFGPGGQSEEQAARWWPCRLVGRPDGRWDIVPRALRGPRARVRRRYPEGHGKEVSESLEHGGRADGVSGESQGALP